MLYCLSYGIVYSHGEEVLRPKQYSNTQKVWKGAVGKDNENILEG